MRNKHRSTSIRLKGYDYSNPGGYFITICSQKKENRFGDVINAEMVLNPAGKMVEKWWKELENKFPLVQIDYSIIMPNHFHGIIFIVAADLCVCRNPNAFGSKGDTHTGVSLPEIVQWFKTMATNSYIHGVIENLWPPFNKRLWQSNYYEHIIRNEKELNAIRQYTL